MGLENLKSIFTEGLTGTSFTGENDDIRISAFETMTQEEYAQFQSENLGLIGNPVDFFSNIHSTGFTISSYPSTYTSQFSGINLATNIYNSTTGLYNVGNVSFNGSVDFFGGSNSYKINIDPPVAGFEPFPFSNIGGYAFADGDVGTSKFLDAPSSNPPTDEAIDDMIESMSATRLGYGEFDSDLLYGDISDDIRFNAGFGWPFSEMILQTVQEGNSFSMFYINTAGNVTIGASGAISNYGPLSDIASSLGFDLPVFDFDVTLFSPPVPTYVDSVFELANDTPQDQGSEYGVDFLNNQRGNAFQTIFPNINYGKANLQYFIEGVQEFSHGSRVISNWLEISKINQPDNFQNTLTEGLNFSSVFANKSIWHGGNASVFYNIGEKGPGPHHFLDDELSFVQLGKIQYANLQEALATGNLDIVTDFIQDQAENWWASQQIQDQTENIESNLTSNLNFQLDAYLGPATESTQLGMSALSLSPFLAGPSTDFGPGASVGGTFDGTQLPENLSLSNQFSNFQSTLGEVQDDIDNFLSSFGIGGDLFSSIQIPDFSFTPTEIATNPDLVDLINTAGSYPDITSINALTLNSISAIESSLGISSADMLSSAEIIYMGIHSASPPYNPRTITRSGDKPGNLGKNELPQSPYGHLGTNPYSTHFITKHPTTLDAESIIVTDPGEVDTNATAPDGTQFVPLPPSEIQGTPPGSYYPAQMGPGMGSNIDRKNMAPVLAGETLREAGELGNWNADEYRNIAEGEKFGLPFYFKDLRDNKYIIFRGFLEDINQELQPEWTEHSYHGRSEPAYVYARTRRIINFNFRVNANTKGELQLIYEKLNNLMSLTYPRYHEEGSKNRMMPPIMSLRIGELFGNNRRNLGGFIESLSYTWDPNWTWEVAEGLRVPKVCNITVSYKVIHRQPPNVHTANTEFLGLNNPTSV